MDRRLQLRTLIYALLIAGALSAFMVFLDWTNRLSWVHPTVKVVCLAAMAIGMILSRTRSKS